MVSRRGICVQRTLEFATAGGYASGLGINASAALAQLVEHRIRNAGVVGSNPIGGTIPSSRNYERFLAKVHKCQGLPISYFMHDSEPTGGDKTELCGYVVGRFLGLHVIHNATSTAVTLTRLRFSS